MRIKDFELNDTHNCIQVLRILETVKSPSAYFV